MLLPFTLSCWCWWCLLSSTAAVVLPILRVKSESLAVCSRPEEALLLIEIIPNRFPHGDTTSISMVLSDLSSGAQDIIVPEGSIVITINEDTTATAIVSKDICLPANHCLILAIYESTRSVTGVFCCGYHHDEGWHYKVTYNGNTIKEGNEYQSSDYLQFGGGCQMPSKDNISAKDRRSLLAAGDTSSAEYSYVAVDEEGRRYFPRSLDISEVGQSLPALPDCTKHQGRTGCIINPKSSRGVSFHLPLISYQQNPACANGTCTLGIPMSKQNVDFTEDLVTNVQHIGFTVAKTGSLPNSSGYISNDIAAGDLDGDGLVDLVVATGSYYTGTNNQIYFNSGNKAIPFKEAIDLPGTDSYSTVVKLADIDNDGILDILLISDNTAFVLFNKGTDPLNFTRRVTLDFDTLDIDGLYALDLSVGDANNDDWLDIIVETNSGIVLFLNMKNGTFDKIHLPQLGPAYQVAFVDIDNDGRIDIISLSSSYYYYYGDLRVFMNNKVGNAGTFLEKDVIVIPGEYERFCVADMNDDEFPDLILAKYSFYGSVELLVNNGGTGFHDSITLMRPQANLNIASIEVGDLNGDGMIDLVFGTGSGISDFMIFNKGGGEFTEAIDLPGDLSYTNRGIVIADVNNDSALDIVTANDYDDKVLLNYLPIDTSSSFGAALSLPGGDGDTRSMAFGDFTQDGFIDIVVGNNYGANQILVNNGDGSFDAIYLPTSFFSSYTWAVAVGDIIVDDDELPDIVVCGDGCDILRNNGNLPFSPIRLSDWESHAIGIGDVNNDAFMDVIIGGYGSNGDVLFINNNDGTFSQINLPGFVETTNGGTSSIALADFNGDNR